MGEITPSGFPYELDKKATYKPIIQSVLLPRPRLASKKKALEEELERLDYERRMLEVESSE